MSFTTPALPTSSQLIETNQKQWVDVENAYTYDNSYAYCNEPSTDSTYLGDVYGWNNFGFSIPSDATIDGISVETETFHDSGYGAAVPIKLIYNSSTIGYTKFVISYDSWENDTVGGSTDLWNATLTPTIVNSSSFGICQWVNYNAMGNRYFVRWYYMTVYYTEASGRQRVASKFGKNGVFI